LGNFPLAHDSGAISSNATDDYKGSQEGNIFLSYDSNALITANDRILSHRAGPEPGVRFLLRDESGKFAWNFTPCSIQSKPTNFNQSELIKLAKKNSKSYSSKSKSSSSKIKKTNSMTNSSKKQPPPHSPPSDMMQNDDAFAMTFNEKLSSIEEKQANILNKTEFKYIANPKDTRDGLCQVLKYVNRELTPPAGTLHKSQQNVKSNDGNIKIIKKRKNTASFPSGHLSEKSRIALENYMDEQQKEESNLYTKYASKRKQKMDKMKTVHDAKLKKAEEESKECMESHSEKIRESVTVFDCSRFLFGHLGILTPGHVLGVKDSLFSDVSSDDIHPQPKYHQNDKINSKKYKKLHQKTMSKTNISPKASKTSKSTLDAKPQNRGKSFSHNTKEKSEPGGTFQKRSSGKQYRLDPYLYSLDQNLLAMFGNDDNAFHRRLRLLDQSSFEREKHKIGVVYVGPDQDEQKLILANETGSISYRRFVDNLGWKVDLLAHQGFDGAMNASTTGRYAKYYCTATYEMAFHVATKMPTNHNDVQQTEKKKHIGNDQVNIIWTDHGREYIVDTIYSHFNQVQIVIYPLNNGLYRIKIHKKAEVGHFGPLLNNMIVRQHLLSILVRITSLYANRTVRYAASVYTRPFVERKKYLDEAIDKNSHKSHESILGAFFPYMVPSKK